jgi:alpha-L-fucosidase 2
MFFHIFKYEVTIWSGTCRRQALLLATLFLGVIAAAQDANFHIYLCLGQSNMEGAAKIEARDSLGISSRFQVLQAVECSSGGHAMGSWRRAVPPLSRCRTGLGPADYFGRTLVQNLPDSIRVGLVHVAVGGCKIDLFDKDKYAAYLATAPGWMQQMAAAYNNNPYGRLVEMGRLAMQSGVIKGILLHQGESNTGDTLWPAKVKKVYDNLLADLGLPAGSVPLLAGEVVPADQRGVCAPMNAIIATLPTVIARARVIPSAGCEAVADRLHFSSTGYRELGRRYAAAMLGLLGY